MPRKENVADRIEKGRLIDDETGRRGEDKKKGEKRKRWSGRVGLGLNSPTLCRIAQGEHTQEGREVYVSRFPRLV